MLVPAPLLAALPDFIGALLLAGIFLFALTRHSFFQRFYREETGRPTVALGKRFGGVVLLVAFWSVAFWDLRLVLSPELQAFFWGSLFILGFGLWDDIRPLSWRSQLLLQTGLALLLVLFGIRIEVMQGLMGGTWDLALPSPALPLVAVFLWIYLILNSLNWVDGLDGLLGSVTLIGSLALAMVSLLPEVNQPALTLLTLILSGVLTAFLLFNWPPARLFAGTTGAYFLGFALATFSIFAGAKVATALLVLVVPVLDALFVLSERLRTGESLFLPDKRHLHYRLREIGWSDQAIVIVYTLITLLMAGLALSTRTLGKLVVFGGAAVIIVSLLFFVRSLTRISPLKQP